METKKFLSHYNLCEWANVFIAHTNIHISAMTGCRAESSQRKRQRDGQKAENGTKNCRRCFRSSAFDKRADWLLLAAK